MKTAVPMRMLVQEMLIVINTFSAILEKETAALKKFDILTVDSLQSSKKDIAREYEAKVNALAERRAELENIDDMLKSKIKHERNKFNTLLAENMKALELMKNSAKRLTEHILECARDNVREEYKTHYGSNGKTSAARSSSMSLSIDQEL